MSWHDVLSNFIDLGEKEETGKATALPSSSPIPGIVVQAPAPPVIKTQVSTDTESVVNCKPFEDKLRQVLGKNPTYTQFLGAIDALREAGVDEGKLVTAALKVVAKQGVDSVVVLGVFKSAISSLATESSNFSALLGSQRNVEVKGRETKIQDLTAQIQGLKDQRDKTAEELVQQKNKLNGAEAGFQAALSKLQEELNDMMGKLTPKGGATNA